MCAPMPAHHLRMQALCAMCSQCRLQVIIIPLDAMLCDAEVSHYLVVKQPLLSHCWHESRAT
jgi:hypothetical protein